MEAGNKIISNGVGNELVIKREANPSTAEIPVDYSPAVEKGEQVQPTNPKKKCDKQMLSAVNDNSKKSKEVTSPKGKVLVQEKAKAVPKANKENRNHSSHRDWQ